MLNKSWQRSGEVLHSIMPYRYFYRLDEQGNPVACEDAARQLAWLAEIDRSVAFDKVGAVRVTTVFVGLDLSGSPNPKPWETAVCTEESVTVVGAYPTLKAAMQGHDQIVESQADRMAGIDTAKKLGST